MFDLKLASVGLLAACWSGTSPAPPPPPPKPPRPACLPIPAGTYFCDIGVTVDDVLEAMDHRAGTCRTGISGSRQTLTASQSAPNPEYQLRGTTIWRDGKVFLEATVTCPSGCGSGPLTGELEMTDAVVYSGELRNDKQQLHVRIEHKDSERFQEMGLDWMENEKLCARPTPEE